MWQDAQILPGWCDTWVVWHDRQMPRVGAVAWMPLSVWQADAAHPVSCTVME